jgi:ABC-type lipoprotein release transport system permease subunit
MKQNKLAKVISLIGVAAGILVIILGIVVMDSYSGSWSDTSTSLFKE